MKNIFSHSILQILLLDVMVRVLIGVVALVQIPVELLKEIVIMMMIVKVISYVDHTTVPLHSFGVQTAATTHFQVRKELLQSYNLIDNRNKRKIQFKTL